MARICREVQTWVETQVEQPIETWENQQETRCRNEPCNWWMLCLNVLFCWAVWVLMKVVRFVAVTIGKWVTRIVCELVGAILDAVAFVVNLILSIPIIGGIIRTILNWATELVWRIVGLGDFLLSWAGVRPRKKMYCGVIVPPNMTSTPPITDANIQRQMDAAVQFFDQTCNIELIVTGICRTNVSAPNDSLVIECGPGGFFGDWWLSGSYFEFAMATCKFEDGFRRVIGLGAEIVVFIVDNVTPTFNGCSFASTHNYVVIEAKPGDQPFVAAHEIGHACWLPHDGGPSNLMNGTTPVSTPVLTDVQIAAVRASKHCVYM